MSRPKVKHLDLDMAELEAILERTRSGPLSEEEHHRLKAVVTTLAHLTRELEKKRTSITRLRNLLFGPRTEKSGDVLKKPAGTSGTAGKGKKKKRKGHGRNGADAYQGAKKVEVPHGTLKSGDPCPETDCTGKVYPLSDPGLLVRIKGLPPLGATVYELEKLRCNLCGTVFTAKAPPGIGEKKYDETAVSMIGLLKYGAGFPFNRLEKLEGNLGIPLPAATQWDLVKDACGKLEPVFNELIDQAAQGEVLHNDDTPMKILELMAENQEQTEKALKRTGLFTSGIISKCGEQLIALFFTGRNHAGENLQSVLESRSKQLASPIQMCDALSRNLPGEFKTILANCLSHGRRRFVDVVENFPEEVRYVLEILARVYKNDAVVRKQNLSPRERLIFHQQESGPLMEALHEWLEHQFSEKTVEPNSSLGEAITYMLNHWKELTLFLRKPGAPLDNNVCERALKKAILHRKNALFYKTQNGARVGDLFMSLIHTAELSGANAFDYLCELQRHAELVKEDPGQWMPWNYRETLKRVIAEGNRLAPERSPPD
ncbi:MAG: IS66 family transposase [Acidobacteria bacterium]|nr:IS66 family transposase [Candidatus Sulfomarinibacter kjeldsenii]